MLSASEAAASRTTTGRKATWIAVAVAIAWLVIGSAVGPLSGKLSEVQTNDNASFLPASAESTLAANEAAAFAENESFPALVVVTRPDGAALTPEDRAKYYALVQQKVMRAHLWMPVLNINMDSVSNKKLKGFRPHMIYQNTFYKGLDYSF